MADTSNTNQYKYLDYAGLKTFANLVNQKVTDSITSLSESIANTYLKKTDSPNKTLTVMYTDDKNQIRTETYNGTKAATMDLRGGLYYATTSTTATRVSNTLNFLGASDVAIDQLSNNPAESYNGARVTNLDFSNLARKATTLTGYGITNAYTKTEVDDKLATKLNLTGGTLTDTLTLSNGRDAKLIFNNTDGEKFTAISFRESDAEYAQMRASKDEFAISHHTGILKMNGNTVLHASNYADYTIPKTGGTFSGNISAPKFTGAISAYDSSEKAISFNSGEYIDNYGNIHLSDKSATWNLFSGSGSALIRTAKDANTLSLVNGYVSYNSKKLLDAGNYTDYTYSKTNVDDKLATKLNLAGGYITGGIYPDTTDTINLGNINNRFASVTVGQIRGFNNITNEAFKSNWLQPGLSVITNIAPTNGDGTYADYGLPAVGSGAEGGIINFRTVNVPATNPHYHLHQLGFDRTGIYWRNTTDNANQSWKCLSSPSIFESAVPKVHEYSSNPKFIPELRNGNIINVLHKISKNNLKIERSREGSTWTDTTETEWESFSQIMTEGLGATTQCVAYDGSNGKVGDRLRITINGAQAYSYLSHLYIYFSTVGNTTKLTVERNGYGDQDNWRMVINKQSVLGWSGPNYYGLNNQLIGKTADNSGYSWRLTFEITAVNASYNSKGEISKIYCFSSQSPWAISANPTVDWYYNVAEGRFISNYSIRPRWNVSSSLGTSEYKWTNVYANNFYGRLYTPNGTSSHFVKGDGQIVTQVSVTHDAASASPLNQAICVNAATGTDDIAKMPGIGFHNPGKSYATLKYTGNFEFMNETLTGYKNVKAAKFIGDLQGKADSATRADAIKGYFNPLSTNNDTPAKWIELGTVAAACNTNTLSTAPSAYGVLFNGAYKTSGGGEIGQIWVGQVGASVYRRAGNAKGWWSPGGGASAWIEMIDTLNLSNHVVPKTGGTFTGNVTFNGDVNVAAGKSIYLNRTDWNYICVPTGDYSGVAISQGGIGGDYTWYVMNKDAIYPNTGTRDLGKTNKKWNNIYTNIIRPNSIQFTDDEFDGYIGMEQEGLRIEADNTISLNSTSVECAGAVNGYGGFFDLSDARFKDFHSDVNIDFDKISKLPKKYFTWKDDENKKSHIGTSAQAVKELYPELVNESNGRLLVDYAKLSIIALAAIDKLNERIEYLESKLK